MGKQKVRRRPDIQTYQESIQRDEFAICQGDGCHNAVAIWSLPKGAFRVICSMCRKEAHNEQRDREG